MAFGFSPKHVEEVQLDTLDKDYYLALAIEAAKQLKWNVGFISETGFIAYTNFSMTSWSEEVTLKIEDQVVTIKSECTGNQFMDWGKNKKNIKSLLSQIGEVERFTSPEEIELKISELRNSYALKDEDVLSRPPSTSKEKITGFFSIFVPVEGYFITPILININLLLFITMTLSGVNILLPENNELLAWGANFRVLTLDGQWWRLFTSCFLHIGIVHLLLNMYALLYIGLILEPYLGKTRFLSAYLITGIAASVTSLWWNDLNISAGASGAIFGMYGVTLALLTTSLLDKSVKKAFLTSIAVFVGYNILNGLKPNSGIDNAAHIGGLLSGLLIGYALVPSLRQFENKRIKFSTVGALALVLLVSSFTVYKTLPNDLLQYDEKMKRFTTLESMALEVYSLPEGTPDEKILEELKERGIYYWKENLVLLESLNKLDLPKTVDERTEILKEYCELRIKSYELIYKKIEENTDKYDDQLKDYNGKIEGIFTKLSSQKGEE
jgi:rhomboid protease GluP